MGSLDHRLGIVSRITEDERGVRRFSSEELDASIERALAALPESKRAAVLDIAADSSGVRAVAAVKLGDDWSIVGLLDRGYDGEWSGHARVRWSK